MRLFSKPLPTALQSRVLNCLSAGEPVTTNILMRHLQEQPNGGTLDHDSNIRMHRPVIDWLKKRDYIENFLRKAESDDYNPYGSTLLVCWQLTPQGAAYRHKIAAVRPHPILAVRRRFYGRPELVA